MSPTIENMFKSETLFRQFYKSIRFSLLTLATDEALGAEICASLFLTGLVVTGEETIKLLKLEEELSTAETTTFRRQLKEEPIKFLKELKTVIAELNAVSKEKSIKIPHAVVYHSKESYEQFTEKYPEFAEILDKFEIKMREYI